MRTIYALALQANCVCMFYYTTCIEYMKVLMDYTLRKKNILGGRGKRLNWEVRSATQGRIGH